MRRQRVAVLAVGLLAVAAVAHHPSASIRILTHDAADPAPHRMQAAVDLGLASVSVLVTWTANRLVAR